MEQLIKESVQFKECTQVALHNVKSEEFDIRKDFTFIRRWVLSSIN